MKKTTILICAFIATITVGQQINADIVIEVVESAGNVQATLSGVLDLDATQGLQNSGGPGFNGYEAQKGLFSFTSNASDIYFVDIGSFTAFGSGDFGNWDASSGDAWHMFANPNIAVPVGYVSGTSLSASATKFGSSFDSLGFAPGSYVTTLTNGSTSDTITVNIGQAVPEPGSNGLIWLLGLAIVTRRRKRYSKTTF